MPVLINDLYLEKDTSPVAEGCHHETFLATLSIQLDKLPLSILLEEVATESLECSLLEKTISSCLFDLHLMQVVLKTLEDLSLEEL